MQSPGLFEVADGGTLFIDEIGELPAALQPKLLRVLEDGSLRRIGSVKERRVDVRVLVATNRILGEEVKALRFREDLYYRINVLGIDSPPLRDHREDIPLLMEHILGPGWTIEPEAQDALRTCSWPGNVRQLKNALERAMILADDRVITLDDLPREVAEDSAAESRDFQKSRDSSESGSSDLASIERAHILRILEQEGGNKSRAAKALGIHRRKLYRLLERFSFRRNSAPIRTRLRTTARLRTARRHKTPDAIVGPVSYPMFSQSRG